MDNLYDVIIIGSGPAGLTAAIYTGRAGLKTLVIAGYQAGGQLMNTTEIENFPGFPDGIPGPELMQRFIQQAERWGAKLEYKDADKVALDGEIKSVFAEGNEYQAKSVILATGALPRKLDITGEQQYWGAGVSSCATCDGAFYKGKTVAVVGGGDSAMEEATFLTNFAEKVYLIYRGDQFRASKVMQDRVLANPKIEIIRNTEVKEVAGDAIRVTHLNLLNTKDNKLSELKVDGMFLAIGHIPVTGYLNSVALTETGYIQSIDGVHTNIEGVFVAGDVEDQEYRQAITAAGAGCAAALMVQKYLVENKD